MATNDPPIPGFPGQLNSHQVDALRYSQQDAQRDAQQVVSSNMPSPFATVTAGTSAQLGSTVSTQGITGGLAAGTTSVPQGFSGLAQAQVPDDYMYTGDETKKKYANDIERTIDEEVARIKNL